MNDLLVKLIMQWARSEGCEAAILIGYTEKGPINFSVMIDDARLRCIAPRVLRHIADQVETQEPKSISTHLT